MAMIEVELVSRAEDNRRMYMTVNTEQVLSVVAVPDHAELTMLVSIVGETVIKENYHEFLSRLEKLTTVGYVPRLKGNA
jgi:heme oxygenase